MAQEISVCGGDKNSAMTTINEHKQAAPQQSALHKGVSCQTERIKSMAKLDKRCSGRRTR